VRGKTLGKGGKFLVVGNFLRCRGGRFQRKGVLIEKKIKGKRNYANEGRISNHDLKVGRLRGGKVHQLPKWLHPTNKGKIYIDPTSQI